MIVYEGTKQEFISCVEEDKIADVIEQNILEKMGRHTAPSEVRSWENSLRRMCIVLNNESIPEKSGIAIEYNIPQTSKRIDFMISGYDENDLASTILIELKQWERITKIEGKDGVVETFIGGGLREEPHPSYQVWTYTQLIKDFNEEVEKNKIGVKPCVYMHNYDRREEDPLDDIQYEKYYKHAPVYTKGQGPKLREFIGNTIKKGDNNDILHRIDNGKIKPSKSLQDAIENMLKGNEEFLMIDEQKVVYEEIIRLSELCKKDNKKRTIIVKGGPGTGKSVVAVNLLAELTKRDQVVQYTSRNAEPRKVYKKKLSGEYTLSRIDNLFKSSGAYIELNKNSVDTLLVDEAHRLTLKSGPYNNLGENQIKEIINASKCSVFFIDESQRVTIRDIGSAEEIRKQAQLNGSEVTEMELVSQFRCNGSNGYLAWLDDVLDIRKTANYDLEGIDYDVKLIDSPNELRALVEKKNENNNRSRLLAGYCWEWLKEGRKNSKKYDIVIDDFKMSWNLDIGEPFAVGETSIDEVGCIHTSQGLEFDYVGVIIGNDMRYENNMIVTDYTKRAKTDRSLFGIKKLADKDPDKAREISDEIIKNTYRTLMSRGMKGCYIYCCDKSLSDYLKERLEMGKDK